MNDNVKWNKYRDNVLKSEEFKMYLDMLKFHFKNAKIQTLLQIRIELNTQTD